VRGGLRGAARTAGTFLRIAVLHEMQYRVNFYLQLVQSAVAVGTALAVLALVFRYTDTLAGWSPDQLLVVLGVHVLMGGFIRAVVQPNMTRLMEDVRQGTLDFALTKPVDAQLLVSIRELKVFHVADVLVGAVLVVLGVVRVGGAGAVQVLVFGVTLVLGALLIYCAWLAVTVSTFWLVRMEFVVELFDGLYQAGRWPVTIYPGWLRAAFTFLVPLAFAVTVPAQALTDRLGPATVPSAVALTAAFVVATRLYWRFGLRHYSGASS
jgi:ABC-2 type transport system permease protein